MPQNFQLGRLPRALLKGDKSKDKNNFKPGVWYTVDPFDIKTWPPMNVRILIERKGEWARLHPGEDSNVRKSRAVAGA